MSQPYSQFKAFLALTKASVRSMLKSPSAVVFAIAFPLVFILVFGFIGDRTSTIKVGFTQSSDLNAPLVKQLVVNPLLKTTMIEDSKIADAFKNNTIQVLVDVQPDAQIAGKELVKITAGNNNASFVKQLTAIINDYELKHDAALHKRMDDLVEVKEEIVTNREFKLIDFILPGQLGFSLLAASVFGTAFVFFHLRQMVVLKRFFATPIRKSVVLLSEGVARLLFQLTGALILILIGKYAFGYTLVNGWITVVNMLVVSGIALLVFMSFGFIISGIAKSDAVIPPLANIFTMPQFLLAGTFFSVDVLPNWLQYIAKAMPLTYFNSALRAIAFDGANLWDIRIEILVLLGWGVIGYAAASKLFKWE